MRKLKVLIIDDSALVRQTLTEIINADPMLEVMATAADPYLAAQKIKQSIPDVITLDIEMPRMDGLTFLKALMAQYPLPVVIISSLTQNGSSLALRALDLGAVEIIAKSEIRNTREYLEESTIRITDTIKAASMVHVRKRSITSVASTSQMGSDQTIANHPGSKISGHKNIDSVNSKIYSTTDKVIAIGASTGGTEAIRFLLKNIPANCPGILIVQHMPAGFTRSFAEQVNTLCDINVKEARDGERVMRGHAYISPGDKHMQLVRNGAQYTIRLREGELVNRHKPSVDVLFNSVAVSAGQNALGIIMTGMGKDGASGLLKMKEAGARTIAQDESSCVVFGMPKEAIKLGAADQIISLTDLPKKILAHFGTPFVSLR
ncbi:chemotaxis response regulator protein-glutamate methylesterase [Cytophagaceae bacterium DM2B3-1]|uniref:Protein-glutamate methylesterase/protein-glutamine glutaminase n=1 Tax=Xanthocytophaga flava TaxID=3048013 RepID=A0ABT7CEQ1_9BACT|nr:chemotaxis response regulator protein-glutamate methylesterase [Xanthocytophaga flavus]MDJ1492183.1 chemotaxis response regulator protein-glutamate methylesterase [Xanthocytophaga flavus]